MSYYKYGHKKAKKQFLKEAVAFRVPEDVTPSAVFRSLEALNCPRSLAIWIIIRDDPKELKSLAFNPLDYNSLADVRDSYAASKLVSKANFLNTGLSTKDAALLKFQEMELQCKSTNNRFNNLAFDPNFKGPNVWLLNAVTRKIANVLCGYSPEALFDKANWGPGVSTQIKGVMATATNKFQCETGITRRLYDLVSPCLLAAYPIWSDHLNKIGFPRFDAGNQVCTVPKDAFTDRVIAVEPGINLWFQKSIGLMIRERLMVHGIDLNSQEVNQRLAKKSSRDGLLATVDFSSASDTISYSLIREVLPPHWFALLDAARSHYGIIEGKPVKWEKFSSMGNGFTFELESLIFFAAAHAVCEYLELGTEEISVFGDDVLLPSSAFDLFSSFCDFLGFTVNERKSYTSSVPFRESCGAHFYDGIDIKPIFIKKIARNLFELYRQINQVREWCHRRNLGYGCDASLKPVWSDLYLAVPKNLRILGSLGYGDGAIWDNFDMASPARAKDGVEGHYSWQFTHVGVTRQSEEVGLLLDRLWNRSIQEYGNNYTLRGRTRVSLSKTLVPRWYNLGPWI